VQKASTALLEAIPQKQLHVLLERTTMLKTALM